MNDLDFLATVLQSLGPAAATFAVMFLWLRSLQEQLKEAVQRETLTQERMDRLHESRAQEQREAIAALSGIKETIRAAQIGSMPPGFGSGTTQ